MPSSPRNLECEMGGRGRARRLQLNLTVADIAGRMNRKETWVYRLERDGAATMFVIRQWAAALEMSPAELAFGVAAPAPERA